MDLFEAMQVFVRVVERGSFSAVARELNLGQPAVSKQIRALEQHLGGALFARSTRHLALLAWTRHASVSPMVRNRSPAPCA
jgi:DNA-binding transcriptional LysR family regulator